MSRKSKALAIVATHPAPIAVPEAKGRTASIGTDVTIDFKGVPSVGWIGRVVSTLLKDLSLRVAIGASVSLDRK